MIRGMSAWVYARTKTARDRDNEDGHRGITHTLPGALGMGAVFGGAVAIAGAFGATSGMWAALVVMWMFLVWALRALPPHNSHLSDYLTATALTAAAWFVLSAEYVGTIPLVLGIVIAAGCFVHSLGDALTLYGSPLAWPFVVSGERWRSCGSPRALRFPAGKDFENGVVFPASVALVLLLAVGLIPGAYAMLGDLVISLWQAAFG
jgi:membrane-bound metal-dependent hydrolase YbcI (DUF457 family)